MPTDSHPTQRLGVFALSACLAFLAIFLPRPADGSKLRQTPIVEAVQAARPSVVNIHGPKTVDGPNDQGEYEGPRRVNGMGTGIVIDERGYILTNHHVIEGVRRIQVTLHDERTFTARLVARDEQTDLAIIHIQVGEPLPLIKIGQSQDLMPGEPVIAVGNAYGYHHTVTRGIISALQRTVEVTDAQKYYDLIQTDASINPGNSGGPLLNIDGEMIGINAAVRVGAQGIGFAIPVDKAMEVAARLMKVEQTTGTWHGISGESVVRRGSRSVQVQAVQSGSPAEKAGVRAGDLVCQIGSTRVERAIDIERALLGREPGSKVAMRIDRDASATDLELQLASAPGRKYRDTNRLDAEAWRVLGIQVTPHGVTEISSADTKYNGGLRVLAVRSGGPAASHDIRVGDILVGIHIWETISMENLDYILHRAEFDDPSAVVFHTVRGDQYRSCQVPIVRR